VTRAVEGCAPAFRRGHFAVRVWFAVPMVAYRFRSRIVGCVADDHREEIVGRIARSQSVCGCVK
jgi:hypothetical protein